MGMTCNIVKLEFSPSASSSKIINSLIDSLRIARGTELSGLFVLGVGGDYLEEQIFQAAHSHDVEVLDSMITRLEYAVEQYKILRRQYVDR
jgi:hypothetical protein